MVTNLPARRERLSFPVFSCLRHFADNALASFHAPRLPSRMFRRGDDDDISFIWGSCWRSVVRRVGVVAWVGVIYLTSELLVWSLSLALRPVGLQFLSSIAGMALVFAAMVVLQTVCPGADGFYHRNIKSKVSCAILGRKPLTNAARLTSSTTTSASHFQYPLSPSADRIFSEAQASDESSPTSVGLLASLAFHKR